MDIGMDAFGIYLFLLLSCFGINLVSGLLCYECDNKENRGCGIHFKAFQFKPTNCGNSSKKCAVQRQPPNDKGWVGILRGCYHLGQLKGINETNGCRQWETPDGYSALYCFCDTDYCNSTPPKAVPSMSLLLPILSTLVTILSYMFGSTQTVYNPQRGRFIIGNT